MARGVVLVGILIEAVVVAALLAWHGGVAAAFEASWLTQAMSIALVALPPAGFSVAATRSGFARRSAARTLLRLGFDVVLDPDGAERRTTFHGIEHLRHDLRGGAKGVTLRAARTLDDGSTLTLVEHSCTLRSMRESRTVVNTVTWVSCPEDWPEVSLRAGSMVHLVGGIAGYGVPETESRTFNRRWRVRPTTAAALLPDTAVALLADAPLQERWDVGHGIVCCSWDQPLDRRMIRRLLERPVELRDRLEPSMRVDRNG